MIEVIVNKEITAPLSEKNIKRLVALVSKYEKKLRGRVEINIISETSIKKFNREWRGIDKTTDVLSFGWHDDPAYRGDDLGEVYVCPSYIRKQALRFKITFREEFVRMLTHSLLHLVGHDHDTKRRADQMFSTQEKVVSKGLLIV